MIFFSVFSHSINIDVLALCLYHLNVGPRPLADLVLNIIHYIVLYNTLSIFYVMLMVNSICLSRHYLIQTIIAESNCEAIKCDVQGL